MVIKSFAGFVVLVFTLTVTGTALGLQGADTIQPAKFSPKFSGDNIPKVIDKMKAFSKKVPQKGEFETTEEYRSRINKTSETIRNENRYVFVFRPRSSDIEYDADKKLLTISIKNYYYDDNYEDFILKDTRKISGSYIARNGFGAKTRVTKINQTLIRLQNNAEEKYKDSGIGSLELGMMHYIYVSAKPETAKKIKSSLAVAYTAAPVPHYYELEVQSYGPSFKDPREVSLRKQTLHVEFKKVTIFNYLTGEIYGELNLDDRFNSILNRYKECLTKHDSYECQDIFPKQILELEI